MTEWQGKKKGPGTRSNPMLTLADFEGTSSISFDVQANADVLAWWLATFGPATPSDIVGQVASGLPGIAKARFTTIDPLSETVSFELSGVTGNASIWFNASTFDLRSAEGDSSVLHEEDLGVDEAYRGRGFAQKIVGNTVDLAGRIGIFRVRMTAQDVGGYVWARAGALPQLWADIARPVMANADSLMRQQKISAAEHAIIGRLVIAGADNPALIRPLSNLRRPVAGPDGREMSIGAKLLVGTNWRGEIDLEDITSKAMLRRWRRCAHRKKIRNRSLDATHPERSPALMR